MRIQIEKTGVGLLNNEQKVQECDARGDDKSYGRWLHKSDN